MRRDARHRRGPDLPLLAKQEQGNFQTALVSAAKAYSREMEYAPDNLRQ